MGNYIGYIFLIIEALAFSLQFIFNKLYQKRAGGGPISGGLFMILHGILAILIFGIAYKFNISIASPKVLVYSLLYCGMSALCSVCFLTAVKSCKMAVVTTFELVGAQIIPFVYGLIFSNGAESITWVSWIGLAALLATCIISIPEDEGGNRGRSGKMNILSLICCLGTFVGNGMISVISDMNANAYKLDPTSGMSPQTFVLINGALSIVIGIIFVVTKPAALKAIVTGNTVDNRHEEELHKSKLPVIILLFIFSAGYATLNGIGNIFQQLCSNEIVASIHFPILNALILVLMPFVGLVCFKEKLSKRIVISAIVATVGIVLFMLDALIFAV